MLKIINASKNSIKIVSKEQNFDFYRLKTGEKPVLFDLQEKLSNWSRSITMASSNVASRPVVRCLFCRNFDSFTETVEKDKLDHKYGLFSSELICTNL